MRYIKESAISGNTIAAAAVIFSTGPVADQRKGLTALALAERTYGGIEYREPDEIDYAVLAAVGTPMDAAADYAAYGFGGRGSAQEVEAFYPVDDQTAFFTLRNIYLYRVYRSATHYQFAIVGALAS